MKKPLYLLVLGLTLFIFSCTTDEKQPLLVPRLFSDHMVLQQQDKAAFWGTYIPGRKLTLSASWEAAGSTIVDSTGHWQLTVATPGAGGPYTINIETSDNLIVIKDVMIGEVWLASGQSNMEMPLKGWPPDAPIRNSDQEIVESGNTNIRMFTVARNLAATPLDTVAGEWVVASPESAGDFSATAYFFAKNLQEALHVPIGIIHSSWGGTVAEAWTSKSSLRALGDFNSTLDKMENNSSRETTENWFKQWPAIHIPTNNEGWQNISFSDIKVMEAEFDDSQWSSIELPGRFDLVKSGEFDGAAWFRKSFFLHDISSDYDIDIGAVDDMDVIYVNGKAVGRHMGSGLWNTPWHVVIPKSILKEGENIIAIRAVDTGGPGSFSGPMTISNERGNLISLEGSWKTHVIAEIFNGKFYVYRVNTDLTNRPEIVQMNPNLPAVLFNGMIHPIVPYTIKGAIWYQGESNVGRDEQYKRLFPALIEDWRQKWESDFPFYFVQIAPFLYNQDPAKQVSQKLRDAQRRSLKMDHTGMVVTLDIGNVANIHPANKQEVGKRLAGLALVNDYGKEMVASGPLYKQVTRTEKKLLVVFDDIGSGLKASSTGLTGFEIAGKNKKYFPAIARIVNNQVEVTSPSVTSPVFVRYAWRDDSHASLFNQEGLPASSFTSEQ